LHIDVQGAEDTLLFRVDVGEQLESGHINGYSNPVAELDIDVLGFKLVLCVAANLLEVQEEVGLQLLHVELEVTHSRQLVHLLNKEHGIVLGCGHEEVVISEAHEAIKFDSIGVS